LIDQLRKSTSLSDIAKLLGYKPAALSYLLYKMPDASKYATFDIRKKNGGTRTIDAPHPKIKFLQRRLADLLTQCRLDIEDRKPRRKSISHGFRKFHSIVTNAIPHKRKRYVLNLDLENFFPSLNFGRVRGFFIKNKDFELHPAIATIIAQIACYKNALPQGSPCSPIISDLIGHVLDVHLAQLARQWSCTYTRYADDLTFSSNQRIFPEALAFQSLFSSEWKLGPQLEREIEKSGFKINRSKTRMQIRTGRQTVTGLTVNQKANVPANYYRFTRAMCHQLFMTGEYFRPHSAKTIFRKRSFSRKTLFFRLLRWAVQIFPRKRPFTIPARPKRRFIGPIRSLARLEGVLNHIYYVKSQSENRAPRIKNRPKEFSAISALYQKFLFFKFFVVLQRPLVVCEGKTDNIYLRIALRKRAPKFPSLITSALKGRKTLIQFFNHNSTVKHLLKLPGGSGGQAALVREYSRMMENYLHKPMPFPVIILIDNDDGANSVFKAVKDTTGLSISHSTADKFYHVCHNLYLVKTPESLAAKSYSCMEDLFEKSVLETKLNGSIFNPAKEHNAPGEYGKAVFAEKVVATNAATIDFSKFDTVFDRIAAVLNAYVPPVYITAGSVSSTSASALPVPLATTS